MNIRLEGYGDGYDVAVIKGPDEVEKKGSVPTGRKVEDTGAEIGLEIVQIIEDGAGVSPRPPEPDVDLGEIPKIWPGSGSGGDGSPEMPN